MSLFQFIVIIASVVFIIFGIDLFQRKKFNFMHFLVFAGWWTLVARFGYDVTALNKFGSFFWFARWADLLVYLTLIALGYFYIELLNSVTKQKFHFSRLVSAQAIELASSQMKNFDSENKNFKDEFVFLVRGYNEANSIGTVIDSIISEWFSKIVVVNDGSIDETANIVSEKIVQYDNQRIILLSHLINRGGWAANKTGFQFIKKYEKIFNAKRVVGFDADGQMNVKDMETFISAIKADEKSPVGVYLGSRFVDGWWSQNMPRARRIILRGSKIVTYIFNRVRVSDPHNGFRVYSFEAFKKIRLSSDGMAYANEINDELRKNQISFKEIPVLITYTAHSLWKGQKNSNAFKILGELIYKKLFFK